MHLLFKNIVCGLVLGGFSLLSSQIFCSQNTDVLLWSFRHDTYQQVEISPATMVFNPQEPDMMVLPLKRAGNLIMLEAIVDGIRGNLILDTGSSSVVLNSIWFNDEARALAGYSAGGITGSTETYSQMRIEHLQISEMEFEKINASVSDLGHLERAREVKILGFMGLTLFREFEVVLDLRNNTMELHRLNMWGNRVNKNTRSLDYDISIPVTVESDVVFLEAAINKSRLTFCLDTGAESNVIASNLPARALNTISVQRRSTLRGAGTQQIEVLHGMMNDLSIEKTKFREMQVLVTNLNNMSHYFGIRIHGMLGCEFLETGVFHINIKKQTLGIVLN